MDLRSLDQKFAELAAQAPRVDEFNVIELPAPATARLATDPSGRRHLLFRMPDGLLVRPDTRSSGVQLMPRPLIVEGAPVVFADLACTDVALNHVFTAVALEALAAADGSAEPDLAIAAVLDRWRDLFKGRGSVGLTQAERLGLFGELVLLEELSKINLASVMAWAGPRKGRHDFVTDQLDLEVKASLDASGSVLIHGLEQLNPPPSGSLHLVVIGVESVPVGGDTLMDIVARLHAQGVAAKLLYESLDAASVSATDLEGDRTRLRVTSLRVYAVDDGFPRITLASFKTWPLEGITTLQYGVDLAAAGLPLSSDDVSRLFNAFCDGIR